MDELKLKKYPIKNELQRKAEAYARYSNSAVSLVQELDNILRALAFQREKIERDMVEVNFFDKNMVFALKELTLSYSSAVTAKIKLDKHMKSLADNMTQDEQMSAVINFIQLLDGRERSNVLRELIKWHNEQNLGISGQRMTPEIQ